MTALVFVQIIRNVRMELGNNHTLQSAILWTLHAYGFHLFIKVYALLFLGAFLILPGMLFRDKIFALSHNRIIDSNSFHIKNVLPSVLKEKIEHLLFRKDEKENPIAKKYPLKRKFITLREYRIIFREKMILISFILMLSVLILGFFYIPDIHAYMLLSVFIVFFVFRRQ
jgi:hypothetical protein